MSTQAVFLDRTFSDFRRPTQEKGDSRVQKLIALLTSRLPRVQGNTDNRPEIYLGF